MARYFIHHDASGKILSVARVDTMPDTLDHPYLMLDSGEEVVELGEGDPALEKGIEHVQQAMRVDPASKKLVDYSADSQPDAGLTEAEAPPAEAEPASAVPKGSRSRKKK